MQEIANHPIIKCTWPMHYTAPDWYGPLRIDTNSIYNEEVTPVTDIQKLIMTVDCISIKLIMVGISIALLSADKSTNI